MERELSIIDVFSGCGGSALGFHQAGLNIKAAVDIDEPSVNTFKANFKRCKVINSDVCYVTGKDLLREAGNITGDEAVMIACPPCQGFSNARRNSERKGDKRNLLVYEFLRLLEEINPYAFVMENVPGLATGMGKPIFIYILKKLNELGYNTTHDIINSADYGVPQQRKRLILVGCNDPSVRIVMPIKTHHNPESSGNHLLLPWKTTRETIGDLPPIKAGGENPEDPLHASANVSRLNLRRLKSTPHDGGDRTAWPEEFVLKCHKDINGRKDVYGRMRWDYPSPTITAGCVMVSKGRFGHPEQDRAISLREAARLQTFPDEYLFKGNFSQVASQIGNAVPPLLSQRIAESLIGSIRQTEVSRRIVTENHGFPLEYAL